MSTINLTFTPEVEESDTATDAVSTPNVPTVSAYNTWYNCGTITWTAISSDLVLCNAYTTTSITSVTCTGSDQLGVFFRSRLIDDTTSTEQWASSQTAQIYNRIGTAEYGVLNDINSVFDRFWVGSSGGLLVPGHDYTWTIEVMKQQIVGTPTLTLTVIDSSIFVDAARLNA